MQTANERNLRNQWFHDNPQHAMDTEVFDATANPRQLEIDVTVAGVKEVHIEYDFVAGNIFVVNFDTADTWWYCAQQNAIEFESIQFVFGEGSSYFWFDDIVNDVFGKVIGVWPDLVDDLEEIDFV